MEAQWTQGLFGGAMRFDGIDDYVLIPTGNSFDFSKSFSLSVWIKTVEQPMNNMDWFTYNNGTNGRSVVSRVYNYGRARFSFYGANLDTAPGDVPFGEWTHIAVTHNANTQISQIYINGQIKAMGDVDTYLGGPSFAMIGKWNVTFQSQDYFEGLMDELKVYNHVLSSSEVTAMIPEPATMLLLALGGLAVRMRRS